MRRLAITVLAVLLVSACSAPDLDKSVAGESAATIRERISAHGGFGEKLSAADLDRLAAFVAKYADRADLAGSADDPGLTVWKANNCSECHAFGAGEPPD